MNKTTENKIIEKVSILHVITAAKNASPFDINMAFDAGFDKIVPYTNVLLNEVTGLTQDAIFSRSPSGVKREAIFIGGRDIDLAMQMLNTAKAAMFARFECSVFADPSGAFTTAAAMVAKVEHHLKRQFGESLNGKTLSVFGATGPVGGCAAIIAALQGACVQLVAHESVADVAEKAAHWNAIYNVNLIAADGTTDLAKEAVLANSELVLCAAAAGVEVLSQSQLIAAKQLKIIADVNAVAPLGVAGVGVNDDGVQLSNGAFGIGALAIGQLKYAAQHQLLKLMLSDDKPQTLDFIAAFTLAQSLSKSE